MQKPKEVAMRKVTCRLPWHIWREGKILAMDQRRDFQDLLADALKLYLDQAQSKRKESKP